MGHSCPPSSGQRTSTQSTLSEAVFRPWQVLTTLPDTWSSTTGLFSFFRKSSSALKGTSLKFQKGGARAFKKEGQGLGGLWPYSYPRSDILANNVQFVGWHGGAGVNTVVSQQESPGLNLITNYGLLVFFSRSPNTCKLGPLAASNFLDGSIVKGA